MHFPVEVRDAQGASCGSRTVRDISSQGLSFYGGGAWTTGQALRLEITVGEEVAGPYAYQVEAQGSVVRTGRERHTGREYCAVAFLGSGSISGWRERPVRTSR